MSTNPPPDREIICSQIWGGIEAVETTIAMPGMRGVLCARPSGAHAGGDVYYTTACHGGIISRICLADLTGHGAAVTEVSQWFHDILHAQINQFDPSGVMYEVNQIAVERGLEAMATAACFSYYRKGSELCYSYAGHPPALVYRAQPGRWETLTLPAQGEGAANIVLGVTAECRYDVGVTRLTTNDRLFVYSDGVTETRDAEGKQFGPEALCDLLNAHHDEPLEAVPGIVTDALHAFAGRDALDHDDVTLLCFEVNPPMPAPAVYYLIRNQIRKRLRARREARAARVGE